MSITKNNETKLNNSTLIEYLREQNINFNKLNYYQIATTHKTYSQIKTNISNYETIEFLGDSLIGFIVSDCCIRKYEHLSQGELTRLRSKIVDTQSLHEVAIDMNLPSVLKTGPGKMRNEVLNSKKVHADMFESLVAAIYLDLGFETARKFIMDKLFVKIDKIHNELNKDSKSQLQEYFQSISKENINYITIQREDKTFYSKAIQENNVYGKGYGKSKKEAEKNAAKDALLKLKI